MRLRISELLKNSLSPLVTAAGWQRRRGAVKPTSKQPINGACLDVGSRTSHSHQN